MAEDSNIIPADTLEQWRQEGLIEPVSEGGENMYSPSEITSMLNSGDAVVERSAEDLTSTQKFERGITDMFGGRYIAPAMTSVVKSLSGDERPLGDIYNSEQIRWDEGQGTSRDLGRAFGTVAALTVPIARLSSIPAVAKSASAIRSLGGLGQGSGFIPFASRVAGNTAVGSIAGATGDIAATTWSDLMTKGELPSAKEVKESAGRGAKFGGALGMATGGVSEALGLGKRYFGGPSVGVVSSEYLRAFPNAKTLKQDVNTIKQVKKAVSPPTSSTVSNIVDQIPEGETLITSAATNPSQQPLVKGLMERMNNAHPGTASAFSKNVISPRLKEAGRQVRSQVQNVTNGVGTPSQLNEMQKHLDDIYSQGNRLLKGVSFSPEQIRQSIAPSVGSEVAENVIVALENAKRASVYTAGTAQGKIPASTVIEFIRKIGKGANPQTYDDAQSIIGGLSNMLTTASGSTSFMDGYKGFRTWYGIKKAAEAGKNIAKVSRSSDDIISSLNTATDRGIDPIIEQKAKLSGFLDPVLNRVDKGAPIELTSSVSTALDDLFPQLSKATRAYNYWDDLNRMAKGIYLSTTSSLSPIQKGISKFPWGGKAAGAGTIEASLRALNKSDDYKAAEAVGRLLNATKNDWRSIMEASSIYNPGFILRNFPLVGTMINANMEDKNE